MEPLEYIRRDARCAVAIWENLLLLHFSESLRVSDFQAFAAAHRKVFAKNPGGIGVVGLVEPTGLMPSAEVREAARRLTDETANDVLFHATVLFGDGFWAGAIRALVNGIFMLSRSRYPQSIFSNIEDAVRWSDSRWSAPPGWSVRTAETVRLFREEANRAR
jgi:hypothetical protein